MDISVMLSDEEILRIMGERLKKMRINAAMMQEDITDKADVSRRTLYHLETPQDVSFSTVIRVLRVLNKVSSLNIVFPEQQFQLEDLFRLKKERSRVTKKKKEMENPIHPVNAASIGRKCA